MIILRENYFFFKLLLYIVLYYFKKNRTREILTVCRLMIDETIKILRSSFKIVSLFA